jgi:lysophospholipase L1-like esterase
MLCCTNGSGMKLRIRHNLSLFLLSLLSSLVNAQDTLSFASGKSYDFLPATENIIHNSVSLSTLFEKLYLVKQGSFSQVNIIHIGDSHIQADFLTGRIRQNFQLDFGNAGRGFIIPGRVARTNEPFSIYTSSNGTWEVKRGVFPDQPLPIGIGGITIRTKQPDIKLSVRTLNTPLLDYGFSKMTLFFQKEFSSFNLVIRDSVGRDLAFIGPYTFERFVNTSTVVLPIKTNFISLQTLSATPEQNQLTLFGMSLENGKPGVLYHSIGINGAKYKHYTLASLFADQTGALQPDLLIISLGTNEALDYPYTDPQFLQDVDKLINRLTLVNPTAKFLLTTLPDSYRRKTRRNPGVEIVRQKIIDYAEQHNLAYWDLYAASGGKHSADTWKSNHLLRSDGIHFSAEGYDLQGNMLYEALIKAYNEYVRYRHP